MRPTFTERQRRKCAAELTPKIFDFRSPLEGLTMRKITTLILLIFFIPATVWAHPPRVLGTVPGLEEALRNGTPPAEMEDLILNQLLAQAGIRTIDDYAAYLNQNLKYKKDKVDVWAAPLQTFARGYGDCEDLSFLTEAVLKHLGYHPRVLGFKLPKEAHVFVTVKINGVYYIFDNTKHYKTTIHSIKEIAEFLYQKYNIAYLVEVRRIPKTVKLLYGKASLQQLAKR